MAASLNKCQFIGFLGADPEIRALNSGDRVCNLRLAVSESWKDKNSGERKEKTEWVRVVIFNEGLVKVAESYLRKGAQVYIDGSLQTRKWQKDGVDQYATEIVLQKFGGALQMLGKKDGDAGDRGGYSGGGGGYSGGGEFRGQDSRGSPREDFSADLDDEIPFISMCSLR